MKVFEMHLAKFVSNGSYGLGGVGKIKFIIFHRALLAHWEVEFHVVRTDHCGDMQNFVF